MLEDFQEYGFEKLEVYQLAEELVAEIYDLAKNFPKDELFGLTSQIKRSSISVALNLAEGASYRDGGQFHRFVNIAVGSLVETKASLRVGVKLKFIEESALIRVIPHIDKLYFKLQALKKSLAK